MRLFFRKGDENNAPPAIEVVTITENNVPYIISYNALEDQEFDNMLKSIQIATVSSSDETTVSAVALGLLTWRGIENFFKC